TEQRTCHVGQRTDNCQHHPYDRRCGIDAFVEADKVNAEVVELFQRKYEMSRAAGESIEPSNKHGIDIPSSRIRHQAIKLRPPILRSRNPDVHVLACDVQSPSLRVISKSDQLCLRILT